MDANSELSFIMAILHQARLFCTVVQKIDAHILCLMVTAKIVTVTMNVPVISNIQHMQNNIILCIYLKENGTRKVIIIVNPA